MNFLEPSWLWALPAAVLPLVIHYLFRRRFIKIPWAASFLLERATQKKNRRRKLEQWVLISLRTLMVMLLILSFARPELKSQHFDIEVSQRPVVIVFDTSISTTRKEGFQTTHERLKKRCFQYLKNLDKNRSVFFIDTSNNKVVEGHDATQKALQDISPRWLPGDIKRSIDAIKVVLRDRNIKGVHAEIYSDFQFSDFLSLGRWPENWDVEKNYINISDHPNWAVTGIEPGKGFPILENTWDIEIEIKGSVGKTHLKVLEKNQIFYESEVTIPNSGILHITVPLVVKNLGWHKIVAELSDDAFEFDNRRYLSVEVSQKPKILIWSGRRSKDYKEDETALFERALDPRNDYEIITTTVQPVDLKGFDMYVLANVKDIPLEAARIIKEEVTSGSFLAHFPGSQTDVRSFNELFDFLPRLNVNIETSDHFFPDSKNYFQHWYGYFRPYLFKNYYSFNGEIDALWRDSTNKPVLASGAVGLGNWVSAGFSLHFRGGDWVGSPLYVGLARFLINNFSHKNHQNSNKTLGVNEINQWPRPGFFNESETVIAVNFPNDESDLETFEVFDKRVSNDTASSIPQPFGLTLIFAMLIFLFVETFWNIRQA